MEQYDIKYPHLSNDKSKYSREKGVWDNCRNTNVISPKTKILTKIELLKLYLIQFWKTHKKNLTFKYNYKQNQIYLNHIEKNINNPFNIHSSNFHKCRIEFIDIENGYPIAHRNSDGDIYAIQLRPLQKKKLLLGCGNNPTTICYRSTTILKEWAAECMNAFKDNPEWVIRLISQYINDIKSNITHNHDEYDTIDPQIEMNPTIIGFFGEDKMPFLKDNFYEAIDSEGICLDSSYFYDDEYYRIIKK